VKLLVRFLDEIAELIADRRKKLKAEQDNAAKIEAEIRALLTVEHILRERLK